MVLFLILSEGNLQHDVFYFIWRKVRILIGKSEITRKKSLANFKVTLRRFFFSQALTLQLGVYHI